MMRPFAAAALLLFAVTASAAAPKSIAPPTVPHSAAMFLASLSNGGKQKVTFKAAATGTHFFFEESGKLMDIPSDKIEVTNLPQPPHGAIRRVDVVIRVAPKG